MIALVRHGQTAANRGGLLQGRTDLPLTDLGHAQAAQLGELLGRESGRPVRVLSSPLRRALDTAAPIAARAGIEVEVDERLVELDYGEWDERPIVEVSTEEWAAWRLDPGFAPPGGESLRDVAARVGDLCEELIDVDGLVVAVSHVSPIKAGVVWALGGEETLVWRLHLDLASVSRIARRPDGRACLSTFNETAHLPA